MPVRNIPKNYISVTGNFSSRKNGRMMGFESPLERDMMILLEFDTDVESFEEQPVVVPVFEEGKKRPNYVPDILVRYRSSEKARHARKPMLAEVKHTSDLERHATKYRPKFAAATTFAKEQGWDFKTIDERTIRGPYLQNLKFLREYLNIEPDARDATRILEDLAEMGGEAELDAFLDHACPSPDARLRLLPVLWHLVVTGRIGVDLSVPLGGGSLLSIP